MKKTGKPLVLIADDDVSILQLMIEFLERSGYRTKAVVDKRSAYEQIHIEEPSAMLLDLYFGETDGLEFMGELLRQRPHLNIIMFTGQASIDTAVAAMKAGAFDYITKPVDTARLRRILTHALERQVLTKKVANLEALVASHEPPPRLLGDSPAMTRLRAMIAQLAAIDATVLIQGQSGTGKELVARELHEQSPRHGGPFVPVNMAALPRELVESTLFGYEKGAYTGADRMQVGTCEAADKGTLFLDEIGEMTLETQAKLLRFLQQREVVRVGAPFGRKVDVRIVAATNRDLASEVQGGRFREDLFYRLNVVPIRVPPLNERSEDVPMLVDHFLQRAARRYRKEFTGLTDAALTALVRHPWPGNIRELENLVERLAILSPGPELDVDDLPPGMAQASPMPVTELKPTMMLKPLNAGIAATAKTIDDLEKEAIASALRQTEGNVRECAQLLGLGVATVYRKIKRYGIHQEAPLAGE